MLIHMILMWMVQMAIVQVINMTIVLDRLMAAIRAVLMQVIFVDVTTAHVGLLRGFISVCVSQQKLHDAHKQLS